MKIEKVSKYQKIHFFTFPIQDNVAGIYIVSYRPNSIFDEEAWKVVGAHWKGIDRNRILAILYSILTKNGLLLMAFDVENLLPPWTFR